MEDLVRVVEAADSGWAVIAIAVLGLYVLMWRFGGELLKMMNDNKKIATEAHEEAKHISESIITNHGSKNLGDAVDRLTEWVSSSRGDTEALRECVEGLSTKLDLHILDSANRASQYELRFQELAAKKE